ncbi:DUF2723 domain-containing protein [Candidatus Kapabacteria bacterium]|nr:DUF2723 domain-containing protein [Candidatus Kapabacteria bacterium]
MKKLYPILIFVILFTVYALTAYPDLTYTDNGELASVATTLGIAHPTGYPLFTIISNLWTQLPVSSSQIFELNLLSSFLTALSAYILFFTLRQLFGSKNDLFSFGATLAYGFGNIIWNQGLFLEVYSLHLVLINMIILVSIKTFYKLNLRYIIALVFLIGLSFGNHLTTVLILPSFLYLLISTKSLKGKNIKLILTLIITFLIGISSYLYLPIVSSMDPLFNWGNVSRSFEKFMYHVQGKQYQIWMFSDSEIFKKNLIDFFFMLPKEMNILTVFIPFGIFGMLNKKKNIAIYLLLLCFANVIYASGYIIHDIESYFAIALLTLEIFALFGLYETLKNKSKYLPLIFLVPLLSLFINYQNNNHSDDKIVPEYIKLTIDPLPKNSIVISSQWDFWCSGFWYKQQIESYRKDIILIEKELLRRTWYPAQLLKWYPELETCRKEVDDYLNILEDFESGKDFNGNEIQIKYIKMLNSFVEKFENERNIYMSSDVMQTEKQFALKHYKYPYGMLFQILKPEKIFVNPNPNDFNTTIFKAMERINPNHIDEAIFETAAQNFSANAYYQLSEKNTKLAYDFANKAIEIDSNNLLGLKILNSINTQK